MGSGQPPPRHGILSTGFRFGAIGCMGCGTFVVILLVVLVLALAYAGSPH